MKEKEITNRHLPIPNPDPFSPDFNAKLGQMISDEGKKFAQESAIKAGKTAALMLPLTLCACTNSSETSPNFIPTAWGITGGLAGIIEEVLEKGDRKNVPKKLSSIFFKATSGFSIGYAVSHNIQNGGNWVTSPENIPYTVSLPPLVYTFAKFTQLSELFNQISDTISEAKAKRKDAENQSKIERLIKQTLHPNVNIQRKAWKELTDIGVSPRMVSDYLKNKRR